MCHVKSRDPKGSLAPDEEDCSPDQGTSCNSIWQSPTLPSAVFSSWKSRRSNGQYTMSAGSCEEPRQEVITNQPLRPILENPNRSGRVVKWAIEYSEFDILMKMEI
ncbi:hypothetical protein LIER_26338 [Lithospermum erythrorhizon]|uniref:Uncharacterized protein n=1 Tax=Lithospermum erythrorhizon TaxID=34254 RepID=A0AAV3R9I7_LITER